MITDKDIEKLKGTFATKKDLESFATKKDLEKYATKKDLEKFATKKDMNMMKKEIIGAIANISLNSPTINQFNDLEKRVTNLETAVN